MTDTSLTDVTVFPEDKGTNGSASAGRDIAHAAQIATLAARQGARSYIETGFVPTAGGTIPAGTAFVRYEGGSQTYDEASDLFSAWDSPVIFTVELHSDETGLAFEADASSDVYLAIDLAATDGDGAYIRHGSAVQEPTDPSVKLGVVDTAAGEVTPSAASKGPVGDYRLVDAEELSVGDGLEVANFIDAPTGDISSKSLSTEEVNSEYIVSSEQELDTAVSDVNSNGGEIRITAPITVSSTKELTGASIVVKGVNSETVAAADGLDDDIFHVNGATDVTFRHLHFDGNKTNQSDTGDDQHAINCDNSENVVVTDCRFEDTFGTGVWSVTSTPPFRVEGCEFDNCGSPSNTAAGGHGGVNLFRTDRARVIDCDFQDCQDVFAMLRGSKGGPRVIDGLIANCIGDNVKTAGGPQAGFVLLEADSAEIVDCHARNVSGTSGSVEGMRIEDCTGASVIGGTTDLNADHGVRLGFGSISCKIIGHTARNNGTAGILVGDGDDHVISGNCLEGNSVGVQVSSGAVRATVEGNSVEGNSSNGYVASGSFTQLESRVDDNYSGDGTTGRTIALGFKPAVVYVEDSTGTLFEARADNLSPINGSSPTGELSIVDGGLQVGDNGGDADPNTDGEVYQFVAISASQD